MARRDVGTTFGVSVGSVNRLVVPRRRTVIGARFGAPGRPHTIAPAQPAALWTQVEAHADATLDEQAQVGIRPMAWYGAQRTDARTGACALGLDAATTTRAATARDEQQRQPWRARVSAQHADHGVVIDEYGSNLNLTPRYARAPKGQRAVGQVARTTPIRRCVRR